MKVLSLCPQGDILVIPGLRGTGMWQLEGSKSAPPFYQFRALVTSSRAPSISAFISKGGGLFVLVSFHFLWVSQLPHKRSHLLNKQGYPRSPFFSLNKWAWCNLQVTFFFSWVNFFAGYWLCLHYQRVLKEFRVCF